MYDWLQAEVLAMSNSDYQVMLLIMVVMMLWLLYICFTSFSRFRFVDGTATSKIRSAAQGHVELKGLAEWMKGDSFTSPFSNNRCVWYHCTIEKREKKGKRSRWTNISDECSTQLFRLIDDTGWCVIDPDYAHVIAETDRSWFGRNADCRKEVPKKAVWPRLNRGNYRFRERLIRPATPLYALGEFSSYRNSTTEEFISSQVEDLVRQWKLQPQRYLGAYDLDENGRIEAREWTAVNAAARKQVLVRINSQEQQHHVLAKPKDSRHPYILSATPEDDFVRHKKITAYASAVVIILIFSVLVIMTSIRSPF
jgi:hypothetical protein